MEAEPIQWSDRLMDITKLLGIFREFVKLLQNNYRVYEFNIFTLKYLGKYAISSHCSIFFLCDQVCTKPLTGTAA